MAVSVDGLKTKVIANVLVSDEVTIISGFFSADMLNEIAKTGVKTNFYFGMVFNDVISRANKNKFDALEAAYPNFKIYVPSLYHVHTKCYLFKRSGKVIAALIGSANCSSSGLDTTKNSELLMDVVNPSDIAELEAYEAEIRRDSLHYDDPSIIVNAGSSGKPLRTRGMRSKGAPNSCNCYSGNPFSAIIPLYYMKNKKPIVHAVDGLNWGNGPHASKGPDMESTIPIRKFQIENYPSLIPFNGKVGTGSGGKITRMQSPFEVTWDDGTVMKMVFQQGGPEIPPKSKRLPTDPFRVYPKALTANSGGVELGKYLRKRMGLKSNAVVTYNDLRKYGRDYVVLSLTNAGNYELDFHV